MESKRTSGTRGRGAPVPALEQAREQDGAAGARSAAPPPDRTAAPVRPRGRNEDYKTSPVGFVLLAFVLPLALLIGAAVLSDVLGC